MVNSRWVSKKMVTDILRVCGNSSPTPPQQQLISDLLAYSIVNPHAEKIYTLSERERTCLFWVAHGKTIEEMTKLMQIKHCTVQTYRNRIRAKLHCKSLAQAVFVAMCYKPATDAFVFPLAQE